MEIRKSAQGVIIKAVESMINSWFPSRIIVKDMDIKALIEGVTTMPINCSKEIVIENDFKIAKLEFKKYTLNDLELYDYDFYFKDDTPISKWYCNIM